VVTSFAVDPNGRHAEAIPDRASVLRIDARPLTYSYGELLGMEIDPAPQIVEGLIEGQTGNILGAPPNVGKSWMALTIARAVASGTSWLGHFTTEQGAVLYYDQESHLPGIVARARMLEAGDPLGAELPLHFAVSRGLRLDNPTASAIERDLARLKPTLVIFDSLTRFHSANENDAGQMSDVFNITKDLMHLHGVAVLFLDHVRKVGLINDPEERLRGSSEKRAWPDCILAAEAVKDDATAMTIHHTKARHGRKLDPFTIQLQIDPVAGIARLNHAGEARADAVIRGAEIIEAIHAVKDQLGEDGADQTALAGWLTISPDTVSRRAKDHLVAGLIASRKTVAGKNGGRPKTVYDVTGGDR